MHRTTSKLLSRISVAAAIAPGAFYASRCDGATDKIAPRPKICQISAMATYPANDPSEDRYIIHNTPPSSGSASVSKGGGWNIAGVFDGHGGWQVSEYVSKRMIDVLLSSIADTDVCDEIELDAKINVAFEQLEEEVLQRVRPAFKMGFGETAKVGSCVLLALRQKDRLVVVNCGDCRAILGSAKSRGDAKVLVENEEEGYVSMRINRDHNARVELEQLRLHHDHPQESAASLYRCKSARACYVKSRLQLTRSIGDVYLKYAEFNGTKDMHRSGGRYIPAPYSPPYVSHQPDLHYLRLDPTGKDKFVILATDGLWDYLSDQEAVDIVAKCWKQHQQRQVTAEASAAKEAAWQAVAAERLVQRALEIAAQESSLSLQALRALIPGRQRRSHHDDTTVVVMSLTP